MPDTTIKISVLRRHVEPVCRFGRTRLGCRRADGGRRFRGHSARQENRGGQRRPSEQTRYRRVDRSPMVRYRWRTDDHRSDDIERRARGAGGGAGKEQGSDDQRRAASSDLTGKACAPTSIHYAYDTTALANGTGAAVVKAGGKTWFFITADYAFGHALQKDTAAVVEANGGQVLGSVNVPLNSADFSSYLLTGSGLRRRQIIGSRQRRRRYDQLDQAGGRVRHRESAGRSWPACCSSSATFTASDYRPRAGTGTGPRLVLLGYPG